MPFKNPWAISVFFYFNISYFLFKDVPNTINIGHYHSWVIKNVPKQLKVTALDFENFPMAFRHTDLKISGIQFHPESILTDYGKQILQNWIIS